MLWNENKKGFKYKTSNIFKLQNNHVIMLGHLLSTIGTWMLTFQVASRHLIPAAKQGLFHPAEDAILSALAKDGNDISVYWGAYESGKTVATWNAGLKLQQMDRLCVMLHGYDLTYPKGFASTLRMRIGVPKDERASLSTYITRPTSVVIDHFDMLGKNFDEIIGPIRELNTSTVLVVSSWERALELRDTHGCKLIGPAGIGRWTADQLESLFLTLPQAIQDSCVGQEREELLRLSTLAGASGFLTFSIHEMKQHESAHQFMAKRAEILDAEWRNGINALTGQVGACAVGRFPDKNGIFHWD